MDRKHINLFIDESGTYYIGEPRFKFFLISGVMMSPDQEELFELLMLKWRAKHLVNQSKCLHAVDFFEEWTSNYRQSHLTMNRQFSKAIDELIEIISFIEFSSMVAYVDLVLLREKFKIPKPPPSHSKTKVKRDYKQVIKHQLGSSRDEFYPLKPCLFKAFEFHSKILNHNNTQGYLNFESQSTSDGRFVEYFHDFGSRNNNYKHAKEIIGMNLHTKISLHGGIELADLIAYAYMQSLRSIYKLNDELIKIAPIRLKEVRKLRDFFRKVKKTTVINATEPII